MRGDSQKATLQQVARAAGVSLKTASRVLNHEPHVKPTTELLVRGAMERLAYQPNDLARSLKARHSGVIGVVVPFLSHYFVAACVQAIHHEVEKSHATIMLTVSSGDPVAEALHIRVLLRRQVEGLIILPTSGHLQPESVAETIGTPVVVIDQPAPTLEMDSVTIPNRLAAREAVRHLIGHGYKRIIAIGANRNLHTISERLVGYREAMRRQGLKPLDLVANTENELSIESIQKAFVRSTKAPQAVFALNSAACIKTLHAMKHCRLRIPEDVALLGFDDFDTAEAFQPSISVISQPTEEIGRRAVELLFKRIQKHNKRAGQRLVLATDLLLRGSCGCGKPQHR